MRILWVGKKPANGDAGDEVFDRKVISALRGKGHTVVMLYPHQVTKWRALANLLRGTAYYRSRFDSAFNRQLVRQAETDYDLTICSWEPLDILTPHLSGSIILIAHNITSLALPALFPNSFLARFAAARARAWERRIYNSKTVTAVATLSRQDQDYVAKLPNAPATILMIPGMPPITPLASDALLKEEIVLLGTYDWHPKHRDVILFLQDYAKIANRAPIFASSLPAEAAGLLDVAPPLSPNEYGSALRFGLITDRFEAGHKLKTLAYIAQNQIVLSFADVRSDFKGIRNYELFIRKIDKTADIMQHMEDVRHIDPIILRNEFLEFQKTCFETFTWDKISEFLIRS
jgi:hypothetical protein